MRNARDSKPTLRSLSEVEMRATRGGMCVEPVNPNKPCWDTVICELNAGGQWVCRKA